MLGRILTSPCRSYAGGCRGRWSSLRPRHTFVPVHLTKYSQNVSLGLLIDEISGIIYLVGISTLPAEVKRNVQLMRELDDRTQGALLLALLRFPLLARTQTYHNENIFNLIANYTWADCCVLADISSRLRLH